MSFNLATILTETTLAAPEAPVCRFRGTTTSYRELDEQSSRLAAGLQAAGLPGASVSAEEIIAYTRERLAAYKYPREVRFVAELPKGPSGKILKAALREG